MINIWRKQVHLENALFEMGQNEIRFASFCMGDIQKGTLNLFIDAGARPPNWLQTWCEKDQLFTIPKRRTAEVLISCQMQACGRMHETCTVGATGSAEDLSSSD